MSINMRHTLALLAWLAMASSGASAQVPADSSWIRAGNVLQTPPADGGGYVRYNFPRTDLKVMIDSVTIATGMAFTSWAGFAGPPSQASMMGDLVLLPSELGPVQVGLAKEMIETSAVHNHLVGELPGVVYLHFHASGKAEELAERLDRVLRLTGTPRPVQPAAANPVTIDSAAIFKALGKSGRARGSVAQVSFVLVPDTVRMHGTRLTPALAYASPINIQQVTPTRAVATGDFAVLAPQLQPLLRALAGHGITATAVHTHLAGEEPTVYFVHFWGDAPLADLLRGLRAVLDAGRTRQ
jgi:hypothetical protein